MLNCERISSHLPFIYPRVGTGPRPLFRDRLKNKRPSRPHNACKNESFTWSSNENWFFLAFHCINKGSTRIPSCSSKAKGARDTTSRYASSMSNDPVPPRPTQCKVALATDWLFLYTCSVHCTNLTLPSFFVSLFTSQLVLNKKHSEMAGEIIRVNTIKRITVHEFMHQSIIATNQVLGGLFPHLHTRSALA